MSGAAHQGTYLTGGQDTFSEAEMARMNQWFIKAYGQQNLDLLKFVEFMAELRPEALMACRHAIEAPAGIPGFDGGLGGVSAFTGVHTYTVLAYRQGILYEIINARSHGATKTEVTDVLSIAWLHSGTVGINNAAEVARDYVRSWDPDESAPGVEPGKPAPGMAFPAGWARDPGAFRSGLDFTDMTTVTDAELRALQDWHRRVQGAVPAYVSFLARQYPVALKVFRARYEAVITQCSLPKQMIAVMFLHTAAFRQRPDAVRRAATMAKAFGVSKGQALHALANAQRYLGDLFADAAFEPVAGLFEDWD
jgi:hypothetical protein